MVTAWLLRLIELVYAGKYLAGLAAAVVQLEFKQLIGLVASQGEHLAHAHIALCKFVDSHVGQYGLRFGLFGGQLLQLPELLFHVDTGEQGIAPVHGDVCGQNAKETWALSQVASAAEAPIWAKALLQLSGMKGCSSVTVTRSTSSRLYSTVASLARFASSFASTKGAVSSIYLFAQEVNPENLHNGGLGREGIHGLFIKSSKGLCHGNDLIIRRIGSSILGQGAAEVFFNHGDGAGEQIAEVVCKV